MEQVRKGKYPIQRRTTFCGLKISVESDRNHVRSWHNKETGESGETKMRYPYGYIEGTKHSGIAGDGMALDVYIGPCEDAPNVYVIHQMRAPDYESFDEYKCMVGFESERRAKNAYLVHHNDERACGKIDEYSLEDFKAKFVNPQDTDDEETEKGLPNLGPNSRGVPMQQMAPAMPAMAPMAMMGPPPIDVDTYDGVDAALGRVGNMKDTELAKLAEKIWGPGYQYVNATPDHVRAEIRNFLLDQRDLLARLQPLAPPSVSATGGPLPGQSPANLGMAQPGAAASPVSASTQPNFGISPASGF